MLRSWNRAACGRRINMCGYTCVPKTDVLVYYYITGSSRTYINLKVLWTNINLYMTFYYPHMPIGKEWIYRLLFVFFVCLFVCLFVRLQISPTRIKLVASNFARRFIGVLGSEIFHFFVNFAPSEAQNRPANRPVRLLNCK